MQITDYHAKYFAHELTKRCSSDSAEKLAGAVASAQADLNPHQVDAALFAFNSPLSKGALLADEVGLGKTIEAGLVLSQKWAERKRCILIITPSNLRKQWHQELTEKFFLPCRILEAKSYNAAIKQGQFRPFEVTEIIICSYQFAKSKATDVHAMPWDLVVIDEAHRLRNVYTEQKFDSEAERVLAVILERDAEKWFKPAKGQFLIFYKQGADHPEYQLDFVAETKDTIYMLEPKASNQMADPVVLAKKEAAIKWCKNASDYALANGGKPWRYVLIPRNAIAVNMTLDGLAGRFGE